MDTLLEKRQIYLIDRTCEVLIVGLAFFMLFLGHSFSHSSIMANDLIANSASVSAPTLFELRNSLREEISPDMRKENFEQRIRNKYRNIPVNSVADGVKHIKMVKYYNGRPVRINIVEVNQKVAFDYEVKPATATSTLNSKRTLRSIASNTNSIVAINGGFFKPQTGVPLGTLMIDGKLYTGPIYDRVALGIFEDGYDVGRVRLDAKITGNGQSIKIDNINQPRMLSSYILAYTRDWGSYAPASPQYGVQLQIVGNKIVKASANPLFIPENGLVLVGPKDKLGKLFGAETVDVEFSTNPKWENVKHIISGGPYLVKNGEVYIDTSAQKLNSIGGRNPRTAIGYTRDNDLILITADGREGSSIGMTLGELAYLMKSLGCVNAINLDGGGSTVMYVNGQIVNRPPQPGGIALSNAVVISRKDVNAW